ncbi:MAG: Inosose dehydratase [Phycisphaerae bacterium]|nr:Inosose dehydratase [Phycisphaerae bacterium]
MPIRLSCHAITWGPDSLGAIKDISDLGFRGIECFTQVADQYADKPALFRRVLDDHGIRLTALYGGGKMLRETRAADVEYNRRVAEFVAAVGGDRLVLGGGDRRQDAAGADHFTPEDVSDLCETMNRIGEACLGVGVKACYHPHVGTIGEERANIDRIFGGTDVSLLFAGPDPAHLFLGGYDPLEFFRRYAARIAYLHFKDVTNGYTRANWRSRWQAARTGGDPPPFCELGRGQLDLKGLLEQLTSANYDGWITTEIDETRLASPRDSARVNRDWWQARGYRLG